MPLVSVCLITYNHVSYIEQAIESVLMQETNFDWEFIIADDFSTDGTRELLLEYKKKHPDLIRLILQEKNVGAALNWFDLLDSPRGKYMVYFEGDDYWTDPYKLQKQADFLEADKTYAGYAHQTMVLIKNKESHLFRQDVPNDISVNDIIGGRLFHTASVMFRRTVLEIFNNIPDVCSGDRLLNFCIAFSGKIRFSNDCMSVYRKHNSGLSSTSTVKQLLLDLNSISFLKRLYPSFPKYRYLSYVYATIGLCKNGPLYKRIYYLFLSFLFSFSYFPNNISFIFKHIARRL